MFAGGGGSPGSSCIFGGGGLLAVGGGVFGVALSLEEGAMKAAATPSPMSPASMKIQRPVPRGETGGFGAGACGARVPPLPCLFFRERFAIYEAASYQ